MEYILGAIVIWLLIIGWAVSKVATNDTAKKVGIGLLERWLRK